MRDLPTEIATNALLPLELRNVHVSLAGQDILHGINLQLESAGCTVVMGPNGAGKTIFLKAVHGLIPVDRGQIFWGAKPVRDVQCAQAMVFQSPVMLRRSALANVRFALKSKRRDPALGLGLLSRVGLTAQADVPARRLSGGQQQRLSIARALAVDPEVLLLDEPTANLDPAAARCIEEIVRDVAAQGVKVIFVTHDVAQARRLADDVVFLHGGQMLEYGPADAFFLQPETKIARAFTNGRLVV